MGIVEYFYDPKKFGDHHERIRLVWGEMPRDFVDQWRQHVGDIVMLKDAPPPTGTPVTQDEFEEKVAGSALGLRTAGGDWGVSLECTCADDFGAGYKEKMTAGDHAHAEQYDRTREAHQRLEALAEERGIRHYVADADDRDSRHSDAYLYFPWSKVDEVLAILKESGASGDVLDVPGGFPVELRERAERIGWSVDETMP